MLRFVIVALLGALALAAGCKSDPPPPDPPPQAAAQKQVLAIEPHDGVQQVTLTPTFKWRLPSTLGNLRLVSFTLFEFGPGGDPPKPGDAGKEIAFASGLHDASPTALDPLLPPPGVVLTGELRDAKGPDRHLKGNTWYRWRIRALGDNHEMAQTDFLFRTREAEPGPGK